jgi:hypothetical protein
MGAREGLPRVGYATALDVYLNVCIVYDMAAMIEYAAVNYFTKLIPKEGGKDEDEEECMVGHSCLWLLWLPRPSTGIWWGARMRMRRNAW